MFGENFKYPTGGLIFVVVFFRGGLCVRILMHFHCSFIFLVVLVVVVVDCGAGNGGATCADAINVVGVDKFVVVFEFVSFARPSSPARICVRMCRLRETPNGVWFGNVSKSFSKSFSCC